MPRELIDSVAPSPPALARLRQCISVASRVKGPDSMTAISNQESVLTVTADTSGRAVVAPDPHHRGGKLQA